MNQSARAISAAPLPQTAAALRVLFALPGLHKVHRGAEVAFESLGVELSRMGQEVTLIGSGQADPQRPYRFLHAGCISREQFVGFPKLPYLRTEYAYEELTFAGPLWSKFKARDYDVTVTCGFPFTNRVLRNRSKPKHVFVTQNGDHMLTAKEFDYRGFNCDGLVCTNPEFFERHRNRWRSVLIPNGVDLNRFYPGRGDRKEFGLPEGRIIALMVSALIPSKRVLETIDAAAMVDDLVLVIAGDGPMRGEVQLAGESKMPGRFFMVNLPPERMGELYRCADVLLHMSQYEPFGNVYVEGLASGLPIVAHENAVTRWILEKNGFMVDTSDQAAVAEAIGTALDHVSTDEIAARREIAECRFSWQSVARQYLDFFREVMR
jgi:glycosyltransferase involved in cell wall biosynthesis